VRIVQLVLVSVLLGLGAIPLEAQGHWGVSIEFGMASFSGHAESGTLEASAHPSSTGTWGLRLDRTGRKVQFSVGLLIASTGVEVEDDDASAEAKDILELLEIAPQVSYLIFQPREAAVRLHAGAIIDHWSPEGDDSRTRVGGLGALSIDIPFSSRFAVQVRWEATITGSVFDEDDLPIELERKSGWSQRWVVGARYGI
jgi:hypothetical protein